MTITNEIIKYGQNALEGAFYLEDEGWSVVYSRVVCNLKDCTSGNQLLCSDGAIRQFRRYIDEKKKNVFWCYEPF